MEKATHAGASPSNYETKPNLTLLTSQWGALSVPNYETKPNLALLTSQRGALKGPDYQTKPTFPPWPAIGVDVEKAKLRNKAKFRGFLQSLSGR